MDASTLTEWCERLSPAEVCLCPSVSTLHFSCEFLDFQMDELKKQTRKDDRKLVVKRAADGQREGPSA